MKKALWILGGIAAASLIVYGVVVPDAVAWPVVVKTHMSVAAEG